MRIDVRGRESATGKFVVVEYDIPYSNLVWNRRYYDYGEFQIEIDPRLYDPDEWQYVTSPDTKEIGIIQKVEYTSDNGGKLVLSGLFAECVLDNSIIMLSAMRGTGTVADYFKFLFDASYTQLTSAKLFPLSFGTFNIGNSGQSGVFATEKGLGLGSQFMQFLNAIECSYSVKLKGDLTGGTLNMWKGVDRSAGQTSNPQVVFDSQYGDIYDISIVRDTSGVKNHAYVEYEQANGGMNGVDVDSSDPHLATVQGYYKTVYAMAESPSEDATNDQRRKAAEQRGLEVLNDHKPVMDVDATVFDASGLRKDYDLGDVVTLQIPEVSITTNARIVETTEIFNSDGKTVELGFGNKRISLIERAVKSWTMFYL